MNAFQCPECVHVGTRLYRMKTHAISKHAVEENSDEMKKFVLECLKLSRKGWRETTEQRVGKILGKFRHSASHRAVARDVLRGHLVRIKDRPESDPNVRSLKMTLPLPSRGRALTALCLRTSSLTASFTSEDLCSLAVTYVKECEDSGHLTKRHIMNSAKLIHRVVMFCMMHFSTLSEEDGLLHAGAAKSFVQEAKVVLRPNSIKNHLAAVIALLGLARYETEVKRILSSSYSEKQIESASANWKREKIAIDKVARQEQRLIAMKGELPHLPLYDVSCYLQNLKDENILCAALSRLETMNRGATEVPSHLRTDWHLVQCYIATVMLLHAQRLSACLGMTVHEVVHSVSRSQGRIIIRIKTHKTGKAGPACFALTSSEYEHFLRFGKVREKMNVSNDSLLISASGKDAQNVLQPLLASLATKDGKSATFSHKTMRKVVETHASILHCDGKSKSSTAANVNRYLCHGEDVTDLHYRYRTDNYVIESCNQVQSIISQLLSIQIFQKTNLFVMQENRTRKVPGKNISW